MNRSVTITHQALSGAREYCRIPVQYSVEEDDILNAPVVHCALDIPREYIPAWLRPMPLETTYFCENSIHMVVYNVDDIITPDARAFCNKLYAAIMAEATREHVAPKVAETAL